MSTVLGVVAGIVVVVLFLGSTPVVLTRLVSASPELSMATAVLFFGAKALAAGVVLFLVFDVGGMTDHVSPQAFGLAAMATSIGWTALALRRFRRDRTPLYDLGEEQ